MVRSSPPALGTLGEPSAPVVPENLVGGSLIEIGQRRAAPGGLENRIPYPCHPFEPRLAPSGENVLLPAVQIDPAGAQRRLKLAGFSGADGGAGFPILAAMTAEYGPGPKAVNHGRTSRCHDLSRPRRMLAGVETESAWPETHAEPH